MGATKDQVRSCQGATKERASQEAAKEQMETISKLPTSSRKRVKEQSVNSQDAEGAVKDFLKHNQRAGQEPHKQPRDQNTTI